MLWNLHTDVLLYILEFFTDDPWGQYQQALFLSSLCKKMRDVLFYQKNNLALNIFEKYICGFRCFQDGYPQIVHLDSRSLLRELGGNFYGILLFQLRYKKKKYCPDSLPDIYPKFDIKDDFLYFGNKIVKLHEAKNVYFISQQGRLLSFFTSNSHFSYKTGERYQDAGGYFGNVIIVGYQLSDYDQNDEIVVWIQEPHLNRARFIDNHRANHRLRKSIKNIEKSIPCYIRGMKYEKKFDS